MRRSRAFYLSFGDVMSTEMLIACLETQRPQDVDRGGVGAVGR